MMENILNMKIIENRGKKEEVLKEDEISTNSLYEIEKGSSEELAFGDEIKNFRKDVDYSVSGDAYIIHSQELKEKWWKIKGGALLPAFSSVPNKSFDKFVVIIKEGIGNNEFGSPKITELDIDGANEENENKQDENMEVEEVAKTESKGDYVDIQGSSHQSSNSVNNLLVGGSALAGVATAGLLVYKKVKNHKKS